MAEKIINQNELRNINHNFNYINSNSKYCPSYIKIKETKNFNINNPKKSDGTLRYTNKKLVRKSDVSISKPKLYLEGFDNDTSNNVKLVIGDFIGGQQIPLIENIHMVNGRGVIEKTQDEWQQIYDDYDYGSTDYPNAIGYICNDTKLIYICGGSYFTFIDKFSNLIRGNDEIIEHPKPASIIIKDLPGYEYGEEWIFTFGNDLSSNEISIRGTSDFKIKGVQKSSEDWSVLYQNNVISPTGIYNGEVGPDEALDGIYFSLLGSYDNFLYNFDYVREINIKSLEGLCHGKDIEITYKAPAPVIYSHTLYVENIPKINEMKIYISSSPYSFNIGNNLLTTDRVENHSLTKTSEDWLNFFLRNGVNENKTLYYHIVANSSGKEVSVGECFYPINEAGNMFYNLTASDNRSMTLQLKRRYDFLFNYDLFSDTNMKVKLYFDNTYFNESIEKTFNGSSSSKQDYENIIEYPIGENAWFGNQGYFVIEINTGNIHGLNLDLRMDGVQLENFYNSSNIIKFRAYIDDVKNNEKETIRYICNITTY